MEHAGDRQWASGNLFQDKTTQLMFAANSFLCQDQHMEALELYTEVLTTHSPEHPHALLNRSLAYIVLSYPELGAADAFRAAVLATRVGEPGWPVHEDIQLYLDMVYAAKKSRLPWAYGVMSCLHGRGMNVSPCSVSLEICPDSYDNVSCYDFWHEVECKAKYRLALALWRCGGGAVRDALNIIEEYIKICPTNKTWSSNFFELGNLIMWDLAELIYFEDGLKECLLKDGILRRGTDDEDMFDMRGIRGLVRARTTMVKREIYPWNKVGRELDRNADHLKEMAMACAPKCKVAVINEVNSGAAKMPVFVLYAGVDIFSGEEILEEASLLQAATSTTESNTHVFCDACAASIDSASKTTQANSAANSTGGERPDEPVQGNEDPAPTRDEGQDSEVSSKSGPPAPVDNNAQDNGDVVSTRSLTATCTNEGSDSQMPSESVPPPSANDDKQFNENLVSVPLRHVPARNTEELGSNASLDGSPPDEITMSIESGRVLSTVACAEGESRGDVASGVARSPRTDGGKRSGEDFIFARPLSAPLHFSRELNNNRPSDNSPRPVTGDDKHHIEDSSSTSEDEPRGGTPTLADARKFSPERTLTPELCELPPGSESILCGHCRKAYFCSQECFRYAMAEYHPYPGCLGIEGYVRRAIVDDTGNHHTIPDMIPIAHARIYELLLARILTLAIQRGEHPLEIEEVRHLSGNFFIAPRFATAFDSSDSDDGLVGEEHGPDHTERRRALPWSYEANIKRPFSLLERMGLNIFKELEWFDAWVINTLFAKIMTSTRFTKGETDDILVGYIHPVLSSASKTTAGWNCEIDGDERGLHRTVIALHHTDSKADGPTLPSPGKYKGKRPAESGATPCIKAGEEIFLRTSSLQDGVDAAHGIVSRFETWVEQLRSWATQVGDDNKCDMESSEALGKVVSGLQAVGFQ